jgi:hypothetical protein
MVGWFGSLVVWLTSLVLLLCVWMVWFFCCMVGLFGFFRDWLVASLVAWLFGTVDGWMVVSLVG